MADDEIDADRQRLRRRARGRADLRLRLRDRAAVKKPVQRLWLSSMTKKAIEEAFEHLRPGEEMKPLEAAARSRSEADWVVGMNATRAASIRLRAAFDGAVSLGRVQTPDARAGRPPRGGDPRLQARALLAGRGELRGHRRARTTAAATWAASGCRPRTRRRRSSRPCTGQPGEITKLEKKEERERPQLLYDLTSLQRHANTLYGFSARRTLGGRPAALRGAQGDHLPAHQLALPDRRHGRRDQADRRARRATTPQYAQGRRVRDLARQAAARARGQRQEGRGPPRDHPDPLRARPRPHGRRTS